MIDKNVIIINPKRNPLLWIVLIGAFILFFLLYKGCLKSENDQIKYAEIDQIVDSIRKKSVADSINRIKERENEKIRLKQASDSTLSVQRRVDSFDRILLETQKITHRLSQQIKYYKAAFPDSTDVFVSIKYIAACDSLADKAEEQNIQIDGFQFEVKGLSESMKKEIALRDTALQKERLYSDTLQLRANFYNNLYTAERTANSPRNRIYMTGTILTDLTGVGYGGGFTLVTKNHKVWSAKFGILNKQLFYQADFGTLLSLRR